MCVIQQVSVCGLTKSTTVLKGRFNKSVSYIFLTWKSRLHEWAEWLKIRSKEFRALKCSCTRVVWNQGWQNMCMKCGWWFDGCKNKQILIAHPHSTPCHPQCWILSSIVSIIITRILPSSMIIPPTHLWNWKLFSQILNSLKHPSVNSFIIFQRI